MTGPGGRTLRWGGVLIGYLLFIVLAFNPPVELIATGVSNGALYGPMGIGIILVYRTKKIINFAAAGIGAVPGVIGALLVAAHGWPFVPALLLALVGSMVLGVLADVLVMRKFAGRPPLIGTIATLGLVQALAYLALTVPNLIGRGHDTASAIHTPFSRFNWWLGGRRILTGPEIFAVVVTVGLAIGLNLFFRRTRIGIAMRASAENPDRALLLGVPVALIGTAAWAVAGLFGGTTIFLRSTLVGVPFDGSLGYGVLLYALAAAVVARMENLGVCLVSGMAVGVLEQATVVRTGSPDLTTAIMLLVVLAALLVQRDSLNRAADAGAAAVLFVPEPRRVPRQLRQLPEVRAARLGLWAAAAAVTIAVPFLMPAYKLPFLSLLPLYALVAVSLVVLTGWAGQISLGQMGVVGVAAALAAKLAADHNLDFFAVLLVGVLAGTAVSVVVGLPALRVQGPYLAVTTLAFAGAVEFYLLKPPYAIAHLLLPAGEDPRVRRPVVWQRLDLTHERTFFFAAMVLLVGVCWLALRFRRSRSGRVFVAVRDNGRAAPSYGVDVVRARLAAFALSGAVASLAGVLFAYQQQAVDNTSYGIGPSVLLFMATAIGGLTSLGGAVIGVILVYSVQYFGNSVLHNASLLVTGPGLLMVLQLMPGGLADVFFGARDRALRRLAVAKGIAVPSLVADRRDDDPAEEPSLAEAGRHVRPLDSPSQEGEPLGVA
ncbi:MAG TPA: ABC transporter permease [Acidimicrobiales bacterium]|nr:ABC transporter permease [Acidimicrobiales bacterium]